MNFDMQPNCYPCLNDKKAFDFEEREVGVSDCGVYTLHRDQRPQLYGQYHFMGPKNCLVWKLPRFLQEPFTIEGPS